MHRLSPTTTYVTILGGHGFASGLLIALLAYWVVQARLDALQLVVLGTALEATLFCLQVPTGAFADAVGRRPATAVGYFILAAGLGLQAITTDFWSLLILQAISGAGWAFLIGSIEAWIAQRAGTENLERVFVRGGQADMAGVMAGLAMAVALGQVDARAPIVTGGTVLLVVSMVAAVLMSENRPPRVDVSGPRWREVAATAVLGLGRIRANRTLLMLVLVALAIGVSSEGWDRLYAAHLMRELGLGSVRGLSPVGWLAAIGLCQSLTGIAVFQLVASRMQTAHPGRLLAALYAWQAVLMLGFAVASWMPAAVGAFLGAQVLRRLGQPPVDAWIARETPEEIRATVLSVVGQADSLGQIVAGPLVGLLGVAVSIPAALAASAGLLLPAGLLALAADRRHAE
jgi:DHA3 family tetracycline resistance protein-like MFS transporter